MSKRVLHITASGFFVNDLIHEMKQLATTMRVQIKVRRGKGFHTYPLEVTIFGHPDKILPTITVIRSLCLDHYSSIDAAS